MKTLMLILSTLTFSFAQAGTSFMQPTADSKAVTGSMNITDSSGVALTSGGAAAVSSGFDVTSGDTVKMPKVADPDVSVATPMVAEVTPVVEETIEPLTIRFNTASARLSASSRARLQAFVTQMKATANSNGTFRLVGYADSRGGDDYNQELSTKRARAVKRWMAKRGVQTRTMSAQGAGEKETANYAEARVVEVEFTR